MSVDIILSTKRGNQLTIVDEGLFPPKNTRIPFLPTGMYSKKASVSEFKFKVWFWKSQLDRLQNNSPSTGVPSTSPPRYYPIPWFESTVAVPPAIFQMFGVSIVQSVVSTSYNQKLILNSSKDQKFRIRFSAREWNSSRSGFATVRLVRAEPCPIPDCDLPGWGFTPVLALGLLGSTTLQGLTAL